MQRNKCVLVRFNDYEYEEIKKRAKDRGVTVSEYIRNALTRASYEG